MDGTLIMLTIGIVVLVAAYGLLYIAKGVAKQKSLQKHPINVHLCNTNIRDKTKKDDELQVKNEKSSLLDEY